MKAMSCSVDLATSTYACQSVHHEECQGTKAGRGGYSRQEITVGLAQVLLCPGLQNLQEPSEASVDLH